MAKAGLPTPRNARINSPADVAPAAAHVGFPAVIKPVSGAASIGVVRVDSMPELEAAYARVVRDMSRARVVAGALVEGGDEDEGAGGAGAAAGGGGENGGGYGDGGNGDGGKGNAGSWINVQLMLEEVRERERERAGGRRHPGKGAGQGGGER